MKTSNKIAIAAAIIFMVLPAISYIANYINAHNCDIEWWRIENKLHGRPIKVLELMDEHTALIKDIYRTKHTNSYQDVRHNMHLGDMPEVLEVVGDTLKVKMPNNGYNANGPEIENSFFTINGLEYIIRCNKKYAIKILGINEHGTEKYIWEEVKE